MSYNTSNPILNVKNFEHSGGRMVTTLNGVINRCLILLAIVMFSAAFAWKSKYVSVESLSSKLVLFAIAEFVTLMVTVFKKEWAGYTAPLYPILEGLGLGSISKFFELWYPEIILQAVTLTFGTTVGKFLLSKYNVITVTDKFRAMIAMARFGIVAMYLLSWILSIFGGEVSFIHSSDGGLLFSLVVVVIAALSLFLDFDFIAKVSNRGLSSYMGWFAAFGLVVPLAWLYLEILKMLAKSKRR
jgi:uncharacterized YccA/Bax inhibitor family protein